MAFQSVPNAAELVIQATSSSKQMVNVLGFVKAGGYNALDIANLADAADAVVQSDYLPLIHGNVHYDGCLARGLENANDFVSLVTAGAGNGTATGDLLPTNVTLCVTMRSALSGRSARGRFYALPTGASNQAGVNLFSSTYGNALEAFLVALETAAAAQGWTHCIISRFANKVARPTGVTFVVTSNGYRNLIMDSQRGRLPKGH